MKKLLFILVLVVVSSFFLFADGIDGDYEVTAKWSVSVFSGKLTAADGEPLVLKIRTVEGRTDIEFPALLISPEAPPTEKGKLEDVKVTFDKKGNAEIKYVPPVIDKNAEMYMESVSGQVKKGKLELKMKMNMKGVPFDLTIKFESE